MTQAVADAPAWPKFDPFSDALRDDPNEMLAGVHDHAPVFFDGKLGAWVLTKYADVAEAMRDTETFSSSDINGLIPTPPELLDRVPDLNSRDFTLVLGMDPPAHGPVRLPMQRAMAHRLVGPVAPLACQVAEELIDGFVDRGSCDLVNEFAYPFSGRAIAAVLGLPADEADKYSAWFERFGGLFIRRPLKSRGEVGDPVHDFTPAEVHEKWSELAEANDLLRSHVLERQAEPKDDVISIMLGMQDREGRPTNDVGDVVRALLTLLGGGQDTTANLVASAVSLLTRNPDQKSLLVDDMSLLPGAIEETLRLKGPGVGLVRMTTRAVDLRGVTIPAESLIYLSLYGANLDPEMFENPGRFDIKRPNASKHLGFGIGRHACVGQPLARLEAEIALEALYRRIPRLEVDPRQPHRYKPHFTSSTLTSLRASW